MSNHSNKQDIHEMSCLNTVQKNINPHDFFGFSKDEISVIIDRLNQASSNEISTQFPDFLFEDGFIEHFDITSSNQTKSGFEQKRKSSQLEREFKESVKVATHEGAPNVIKRSMLATGHSLENIHKSIKRNWKKHIDSLIKYKATKNYAVFLMYYSYPVFESAEINTDGKGRVYQSYRITFDKAILHWIHQNRNNVDIVIMASESSIEVINIQDIPNLLNTLPEGINSPSFTMESHTAISFFRNIY